jgi:flagellar hook-associated protein 2
MGISSSGLVSGLDTEGIIKQLMALEQRPIVKLQEQEAKYQAKNGIILTLNSKLASFKSIASTVSNSDTFNTKTSSVTKTTSGNDVLSASVSSAAIVGKYSIQVQQLAQSHKLSAQGWADTDTTAVASGNGGSFSFKVGNSGVVYNVGITTSTTLQGLKDAINNLNAGVTASIINDGTATNPYRLSLTSNTTGDTNTVIITTNNTQLDFTNKAVENAYAYTNNSYSGTVASGGTYTGTTNKSILIKMVTAGSPASTTAKYKYSTDGGVSWKGAGGATYSESSVNGVNVAANDTLQNIDGLSDGSTSTEGVKVKFTSGTLTVSDQFSIDVFNPEMQAAQNAVIQVGNLTLSKSSNTITDAIDGVTLNLLKAESSAAVNLTVSLDTSSPKGKITDFVNQYNDVMKYLNDQLKYDPKSTMNGPLVGDSALTAIRKQMQNIVSGTIPGLGRASFTNLSQIGITTDKSSGLLTVNDSKLSSSLSSDPDGVKKLFIATGTASNASVTYVGKTSKTQPGAHAIDISTAPEKAVISGDQAVQSSGITSQEILTFKFAKNYNDSSPAYTSFNVTLSSGRTAAQIVDDINSSFSTNKVGLVASQTGNILTLTSSDYGDNVYFQVTSDQASSTAQTGFGTTTKSDTGVTVVGNINGRRAEGSGNQLNSKSGQKEDGLSVKTTATTPGLYGTMTVTTGAADQMVSILGDYVDPVKGVLKAKEDSYDTSTTDIENQIKAKQDRLAQQETALRGQFARLEVVLAQYQQQSQTITTQLAGLSSNWVGNKR